MPSRLRIAGTFVLVLTCVDGCGDDESGGRANGGQCEGDFAACGGELLGTWITTDACLTLPTGGVGNEPYAACATKPKSDVSIEVSGSITFRSDGTFQSAQTTTASAETRIANECIAKVGNGQLTCDALKGTSRGDACLIVQNPQTEMVTQSGRYSVQSGTLMIQSADDSDGDSGSVTSYCVRGDRLTVQTLSTNGAVIRSVGRRMR